MNVVLVRLLMLFCLAGATTNAFCQKVMKTGVLVIGGGTSGTAAAIQAARMGVPTLVVEETPWLGGMISAAGVSAVDGNHRLPSGLWAEFRSRIYQVYGGPEKVETGWVSNTLFEPHIADSIFKAMVVAEKNLSVIYTSRFENLTVDKGRITAVQFIDQKNGQRFTVEANVFIDATELGDVLAAAKIPFDIGMEAGKVTGERVGVEQSNDIVQDLTYVATLKDFGPAMDCTIVKPAHYDPKEFDAASTDYYFDKTRKAPSVDGKKMLEYGKLPNGKYMINWPNFGNDIYLNIIGMTPAQREKELQKAKEQTLRFVYFIQTQLGFKNLGLADDEFPTQDRLALMPYHRESRRVKGVVRFTMRHLAEPFTYGSPLYRTGIAVGDYPIDHHHKKNPEAPQHLEFYSIPSFNVPLGALVQNKVQNLVIAEKSISVSNVVNGTTRLQPCVLLIGQAAGTLAAMAFKNKRPVSAIAVRAVQQQLLTNGAMIMPYIDVPPTHPSFASIQRIGATGILQGRGIPYKWANQTWFYPDSLVRADSFRISLNAFQPGNYSFKSEHVTIQEAIGIASRLHSQWWKSKSVGKPLKPDQIASASWQEWGLKNFDQNRSITREELAVLLDKTSNPFENKPVNHEGRFTR